LKIEKTREVQFLSSIFMEGGENMAKPIREDKIEKEHKEMLTLRIAKGRTCYYITAFNENGEPVAFGVRMSLEKAFWGEFASGFYDYLKMRFRKGLQRKT
jgi:hypothetical protein